MIDRFLWGNACRHQAGGRAMPPRLNGRQLPFPPMKLRELLGVELRRPPAVCVHAGGLHRTWLPKSRMQFAPKEFPAMPDLSAVPPARRGAGEIQIAEAIVMFQGIGECSCV
jgi:hypothetical protein